jgi:hypothetical protein
MSGEVSLEDMVAEAREGFKQAELNNVMLTSQERRDLLEDGTEWDPETCAEVVRLIDEQDASRWRALMRIARIKMQGSANLDPQTGVIKDPTNWVHFGAEFWSIYPAFEEHGRPGDTTEWGCNALIAIADHVLLMDRGGKT